MANALNTAAAIPGQVLNYVRGIRYPPPISWEPCQRKRIGVETRRLHLLRIHGLSADYAGAETSIGTEPLPKSLPERHVRPLDFSVSLPRNIGFPEPLDFGNRVFTRF